MGIFFTISEIRINKKSTGLNNDPSKSVPAMYKLRWFLTRVIGLSLKRKFLGGWLYKSAFSLVEFYYEAWLITHSD